MALFNVTNLDDAGAGSLRQAILDANFTAGADEIQFSSISGTITLTSGKLSITDSLTINGVGADLLTVSGNNTSRVFNIDDGTSNVIDVYLNGLTISDGFSNDDSTSGGGIYNSENLTITNSTISGNREEILDGGGIYNTGTATISNSRISDNYASNSGGGIANSIGEVTITNSIISGNQSYYGGGLVSWGGTVTIINSTISENQTLENGEGGGIFNFGELTVINSTVSENQGFQGGGGIANLRTATIINSTISKNQTTGGGGGIYSTTYGITTITSSTISENQASVGGGVFKNFGDLAITNTIVANNLGGDCFTNTNIGTIITNINNLIEDGSCNPLLSGDPNLGPLQDNGGPTFTQALLAGSIAIDAGSNAAIPPGILTDQRGTGFPRIINGIVDIGAYEAGQNVPPVPEPSSLFSIITLGLVVVGSWRRRRK